MLTYLSLFTWFVAANFPESFEDVVNLLVPELQRRGVYWQDYAVPGGTLRENIYETPGQKRVPDSHPAAKYRKEREALRAARDAEEEKATKPVQATNDTLTNGFHHPPVVPASLESLKIGA